MAVEVSCDSAGLGESASVSLPYGSGYSNHRDRQDQLSPSSIQDWSDEQLISDVLERAHILENIETEGCHSIPESRPTVPPPQDTSVGAKDSYSSQKVLPGVSELKHGENSRRVLVDSKRNTSLGSSWSSAAQVSNGSVSPLSSSSHRRWREEGRSAGSGGEDNDSDKTPTPPHETDSGGEMTTPPRNTAPPPHPHQHHHNHLHPPPFVTPLSARTGHYHLHPDVLHQQFSPDVSMLPVPHILCPSSSSSDGDSTTFGAMPENDYTLDENVHMADMIALKYLGMPSTSGSHSGSTVAAESIGETNGRNRGTYLELFCPSKIIFSLV